MKNLKNFLKINGLTNDPNQQEHKFESAIHKKYATKTITLSNQQKMPLTLLELGLFRIILLSRVKSSLRL